MTTVRFKFVNGEELVSNSSTNPAAPQYTLKIGDYCITTSQMHRRYGIFIGNNRTSVGTTEVGFPDTGRIEMVSLCDIHPLALAHRLPHSL